MLAPHMPKSPALKSQLLVRAGGDMVGGFLSTFRILAHVRCSSLGLFFRDQRQYRKVLDRKGDGVSMFDAVRIGFHRYFILISEEAA